MPFSIVLTKEGTSQLISLVPSTWIIDQNQETTLYWPRSKKNSDLEILRRDENSIPLENWRKLKCKVKLKGIETFAEGIKLEELYSKFEDTEDEERYHKNREYKRKHPTFKNIAEDLIDVNSEFVKMSEDEIQTEEIRTEEIQTENIQIQDIHTEEIQTQENPPSTEVEFGETEVTLSFTEFNKIITEKETLNSENKNLKELLGRFQNLEQIISRGFASIQVQLDKLFDLQSSTSVETVKSNFDDDLSRYNIQFPIKSIKELDLLEDKLMDTEFGKALVKNFSKICGTSGVQKISKIGLHLVRFLFTDELLSQLTWKGIKGCEKVPFVSYLRTRNLFHQIVLNADRSCSAKEADLFLQNSAIKHSSQRIKRKSCEAKISYAKKKKSEEDINENELQGSLDGKKGGLEENKKHDTSVGLSNCSTEASKKVTLLSDVKNTWMNKSFNNLLYCQDLDGPRAEREVDITPTRLEPL